jgi:predicted nucleic acid-binding protein
VIVLDASAVVDLLLDLPPHAGAIRGRIRHEAGSLLVPHLLDAEVGQVLHRYVRLGELVADRAEEALEDLSHLPLQRYAHGPLLVRAFELRENATFYDALYIALAETVDAPLLTRDVRLGRIAGHGARVEVLA